jgi:hypothetical protein
MKEIEVKVIVPKKKGRKATPLNKYCLDAKVKIR